MKIPLKELLDRIDADDIVCVDIIDHVNCKDISYYVVGRNAIRDPVIHDYLSANVSSVGVNIHDRLCIEVVFP